MDEKVLEGLLFCIEELQAQVSAHQTLLIALLSAAERTPEQAALVKEILGKAEAGVQATLIASPLPDNALALRQRRLIEMLPLGFRSAVEN
ncbi:hypothetical protein [Thauera sp. 63]|uniref:hypothetical protein n=1 Tax=Thauera sp. 63 TaxID=497321 RepID=UPI0002D02F3C|nr:hypothetical protein [Thauera sp. 63]ENO74793.1 hypothetical protein C664_18959 [Thauera sp. 63]